MKLIFSLITLLIAGSIYAQTELDAGSGTITSVRPWGDGTLLLKSEQYSKNRDFVYCDAEGKMLWKKKIKTFNTYNDLVTSHDSKYSYLINQSWSSSQITEKKDEANPIRINRIDLEGNIKEFIFSEAQIAPLKSKNLERVEIAVASVEQLTIILTVRSDKKKNTSIYFLLQMNEHGALKISPIEGLSTNIDDRSTFKDSYPKFIFHDDKRMIFCQNTFDKANFYFKTFVIDLLDPANQKMINSTLKLSSISGFSTSTCISSESQQLGVYNTDLYISNTGEGGFIWNTLESCYSTKLFDDKLFIYGVASEDRARKGIWYASLDLKGDEIQNETVQKIMMKDISNFPIPQVVHKDHMESANLDYNEGELKFVVKNSKDSKFYMINEGKAKVIDSKNMFTLAIAFDKNILSQLNKSTLPKYDIFHYNIVGSPRLYIEKNNKIVMFE